MCLENRLGSAHVGSNPTPSAIKPRFFGAFYVPKIKIDKFRQKEYNVITLLQTGGVYEFFGRTHFKGRHYQGR